MITVAALGMVALVTGGCGSKHLAIPATLDSVAGCGRDRATDVAGSRGPGPTLSVLPD